MKIPLQNALVGALIVLPLLASAEVQFSDNHVWRRAKTLAAGQQVFSFESSYENSSDRFAADGRAEPLGTPFARALTWKQLMSANSASAQDLQNFLKSNGLNPNDVAATSNYQVNRQDVGFGLNWAYGLTSSWMIGVEIPVTYTLTRVSQSVDVSPALNQAAAQTSIGRPVRPGVRGKDVRQTIRDLAQQQLASEGYDSVPAQQQTWNVGDITLMNQVALLQTYHWTWALQQMARFPTAQNPSVSDYLQTSQDEGPVDLGISSLLDYQMSRAIVGLRFGFVAQLPDTARMHAPGETDSSGVDPIVKRDLGDWAWVALDTEYHLTRRLDFTAQYSFLSKAKDRYSGTTFSQEEYDLLAANSDERLHETRVGLLYRMGSNALHDGISHKWLMSLDYSYPWIGANATEAATTSVELINYF